MREIAHAPIITRDHFQILYISRFFSIVISYQARPSDKFYISWSRHPRALACASITHDASPDRLDRVARCHDARSPRLAPCLASHLASPRTLPRCHDALMMRAPRSHLASMRQCHATEPIIVARRHSKAQRGAMPCTPCESSESNNPPCYGGIHL